MTFGPEIHCTALCCTLKRSAFIEGVCGTSHCLVSVREKERGVSLNSWATSVCLDKLYCGFLLRVLTAWTVARVALFCAELLCGCCNLLSAWPDYCLFHIVWWRAAGWREGGRLCSDLLLHKEDYLFINVSIWTFAIFGCLSSLTHCINLMRFKSKYIKAEIRHKCYFPGVVMNQWVNQSVI